MDAVPGVVGSDGVIRYDYRGWKPKPKPELCEECGAKPMWAIVVRTPVVHIDRQGNVTYPVNQTTTYWCRWHVPK